VLKRKLLLLAATFLFLIIAGPPSSAQRGGNWVSLGEANVDGNGDHDTIKVGGGSYRALQIHVERAPIDFQHVVVHYDNGGDDRLPLQGRVPAGGKSRVLDLKGGNRNIRSVDVWYTKGNWGHDAKPKMLLYGHH
jgi:hypothetical protein